MTTQRSDHNNAVWQPLRNPLFLAVWLVTLVSNIGAWMQGVGASWLMTSLSSSPDWVALVQTATTAPIMLLALPAGAFADIVDRRRLLLVTQVWMFLCALGLWVCTLKGITDVWLLLGFTFLMGCGSAMCMPAWSAVIPELIPKNQLHAAITLNGLGMNVARAVGPAVAGYLISLSGTPSVFLVSACSSLAVVAVLLVWKRQPNDNSLPAERLLGAMRSGLRYARYSDLLPAILIRGIAFFFFASSLWALLPAVVSAGRETGASEYGWLMTCIGAGAVLSAAAMPTIRRRVNADNLVRIASVIYALSLVLLATQSNLYALSAAMLAAGAAWIYAMSSLQVSAQASLPDWVRARGLSVFMMVFMSGMTLGSLSWGYLSKYYGLETSLIAAAAGLVLGVAATWRLSISGYENVDFTPSQHWPQPLVDQEPTHDQGPVMVTIDYQVEPAKLTEFRRLTRQLQKMRKRDGAYFWEMFQDTAQGDRYIECFMVESWLEHLRLYERVSKSDRELQLRMNQCLIAGTHKTVRRYVANTENDA